MNAVAAFRTWVVGLVSHSENEGRVVKGEMPEDEKALRDRFFAQADKPEEKRTPLQERMQSGGA